MEKKDRLYLYTFLSRVYEDALDKKFLANLKQNPKLLSMVGEKTALWFSKLDIQELHDKLNADYSSIFLLSAKPIETSVINAKDETLVDLQIPDHISIKLTFMQNLIDKDDIATQKEFLEKHLLNWAVSYFIGIKQMCSTPFYEDLCDFTIEFLTADYKYISSLK